MHKKISILALVLTMSFTACQVSDFEEAYTDPSKIAVSSIEKQFTGLLQTNRDFVLPAYRNYFVVLRVTSNRYNQTVGWVNGENQYVPGSAAIEDKWNNFYQTLAQYRELEKIYEKAPAAEKEDKRIYMIAATTYLYDELQKMIDLHGDVPFAEAGRLSQNGGDYEKSYPKYDKADDLYKKMLDDLKTYADQLSTMTLKIGISPGFRTQDYILKGDLTAWRRYVNSLRLRMLTRVSANGAFSARSKTEIAEILGDASKFPVVTSNAQNIQITVFDLNTSINSRGFRTGLEDWNGNVASKAIIDHLNTNEDPRIRFIFEPGTAAQGKYTGLNQMDNESKQTADIASNTISIYNRSTLSRNQFFPGVIINAAEVSLLAAEYYLGAGNDASAKMHYEMAIRQSAEFYNNLRKISNDNTVAAPADINPSELNAYLAKDAINWDKASNAAAKIKLIASQKWIHFNVVQAYENWSELRRLDALDLKFWVDNSNNQKLPPTRWYYPGGDQNFNGINYQAVKANDKLDTKIFWDIK
jgi:tetratricopeptide (TPR) repeat protein